MGSLVVVLIGLGPACRTAAPLPPADLSAPGWRVQQGQALWRPEKGRPELAGELIVATNRSGAFYIQFAKDPFPLVTARVANGYWQIMFGGGAHTRSGRGRPPSRFGWFELPKALAGQALSAGWQYRRVDGATWRLENRRTGEHLEGYLWP